MKAAPLANAWVGAANAAGPCCIAQMCLQLWAAVVQLWLPFAARAHEVARAHMLFLFGHPPADTRLLFTCCSLLPLQML